MAKLGRAFYARPTLLVARDLLGKYLYFQGKVGRVVETEAYLGPEDLGSHARSGVTKRNFLMFGTPGFVYVYMTYGLHYLINITTEPEGTPGAVLIRALEPVQGITGATNGPARLTKALGINLTHKGLDATGTDLYLEDRGDKINDIASDASTEPASKQSFEVVETTRIGIDYAGEYSKKPWRFYIRDNKFVSRK